MAAGKASNQVNGLTIFASQPKGKKISQRFNHRIRGSSRDGHPPMPWIA